MSVGVYAIENQVNGKIYIGASANIQKRFMSHKYNLRGGYHGNSHLQASWNKYGEGNFNFFPLMSCKRKELTKLEQKAMDTFNAFQDGYNQRPIADRQLGFRHSVSTKLKLSMQKRGKKLSVKHKKAIGEAHKGRVFTPERNMKVSIALTGRTLSEQHRKHLSESHKGYVIPEDVKLKMSLVHKGRQTGENNHRYKHNLIRPPCLRCQGTRIESSGRQWHCLECGRYFIKDEHRKGKANI